MKLFNPGTAHMLVHVRPPRCSRSAVHLSHSACLIMKILCKLELRPASFLSLEYFFVPYDNCNFDLMLLALLATAHPVLYLFSKSIICQQFQL